MLFSPWIDLLNIPQAPADVMTGAAWWCAHVRAHARSRSPLQADLRGLPPTLIQAGADELLRRDAVDLHDALDQAGVAVRCEIVPRALACLPAARRHAAERRCGDRARRAIHRGLISRRAR